MYMIYWVEKSGNSVIPKSKLFQTSQFNESLKFTNDLRKRQETERDVAFVTMTSEHPDSVGKLGVDAVEDGRTPDGHEYEWTKKHRGGPPLPLE